MSKEWGPHMERLNTQEQVFVCLLFENLGSITKTAERAGYKHSTRGGMRLLAHRLLHRPDIADAVVEESRRRTVFLAPKAQKALNDLLAHPEHPDHMKALKLVRDDSKVSVVAEKMINHRIDITISQNEKLEAIKKFAVAHGMDIKTLIGYDPDPPLAEIAPPIDAEYAEIPTMSAEEEQELREMGVIA